MLLACWNAERTVERALTSALEPRGLDLEVIVVDDGSTDETAEVVRRLAAADDRVRLVQLPENVGVSEARNRGLDLARGDWLTILDADDRFTPGGLARLAAAVLGTHPGTPHALAVIGQQYWTDGHWQWITRLYDNPDIRRPGRKALAEHPGLLFYASPHGKLLHRSTWHGLRFTGRVLGDQPWIIRALLRAGDQIEVLPDDVYAWHRPPSDDREASITSRSRASAARMAEATAMARVAFDSVASEAASLPEARRQAFLATYLGRLVRYDLSPHVTQALDRADPQTAVVIDAIGAFVESLPPDLLASAPAFAGDALMPTLRHWHRLDAAGRAAFERLMSITGAVAPSGRRRRAANLRERVAMALALDLGLPRQIGARAAETFLFAASAPGFAWRRVRGAVREAAAR